jgi:hypothetical protein
MSVSRSARIEIVLCVAALAGCMTIYPDPELPDVEVEWYEGCRDDSSIIVVTLAGVDDTMFTREVTVPCADMTATFEDVPRQRYALDGSVRDEAGDEYTHSEPLEIDLRNGVDKTAYLFFRREDNFGVTWQFEGGSTCASLGAAFVSVRAILPDDIPLFAGSAPCNAMFLVGAVPEGTFDIDLAAADANGMVVATAPRIEQVSLGFGTFTDLGLVTLTPCAPDCM